MFLLKILCRNIVESIQNRSCFHRLKKNIKELKNHNKIKYDIILILFMIQY